MMRIKKGTEQSRTENVTGQSKGDCGSKNKVAQRCDCTEEERSQM